MLLVDHQILDGSRPCRINWATTMWDKTCQSFAFLPTHSRAININLQIHSVFHVKKIDLQTK